MFSVGIVLRLYTFQSDLNIISDLYFLTHRETIPTRNALKVVRVVSSNKSNSITIILLNAVDYKKIKNYQCG